MKAARNILVLLLFGSWLLQAAPQEPDGEWRHYGGDAATSNYSPLAQINKTNVQKLQIPWEWKISGNMNEYGGSPNLHRFESMPLMFDDVLYFPTPYHHVVAVAAETGRQIWDFDPHVHEWGPGESGPPFGLIRGLASWTDGKQRRLLLAARGRLFAIDAATGKLIPRFGHEGLVDMTQTLMWKLRDKTAFSNSSPAVVYKNLVIVGSSTPDDANYYQNPPGDVQAFDARTGKHIWSFHTVPQQGEYGNETLENDSWKYIGHANAWPTISVDEKRGLVYLPLTSPSNDYYGGERKGNNLFGDSLVCLDANTGKRVWHFQTVHHDVWDYDGVMGANLLTIHVDGKPIDVAAAVSKTGFTYVFDRVTGKPIWPIEERPVPQTDVPGEKTSPTQPFPTKPPAFAKQGFSADDVVDFTPEIRRMALEKLKSYRVGPIFSPPSIQGTVDMPYVVGGANWGAASVDPDKGILYIRAENLLGVIRVTKDFSKVADLEHIVPGPESSHDGVALLPTIADGIPLNKPPYSTITAIDLNEGEILWQETNGDMPEIHNNPLLKGVTIPPTGVFSPGNKAGLGRSGLLVTAGGLIFNGPGDHKLYARDKDTGKMLWSADLKFRADSTPMTYRTRSGKQFVVVATGNATDSTMVAFALPSKVPSGAR